MTATIRTILTPVDGSDHARRAAGVASDMATRLDVPLVLFHAFPMASIEIIGMTSLSRDELGEVSESAGRRIFDAIREDLGDALAQNVTEENTFGDPADEIIRRADDDPSTLIAMGRRGLSRMQSLLLGSVSEKVLRRTKSPVLVLGG